MAARRAYIKDTFNFGKYNGETFAQVYDQNPGYLTWVLRECNCHIDLLTDLRAFLGTRPNPPAETALQVALRCKHWKKIATLISENPGEILIPDSDGNLPLHRVTSRRDLVQRLMDLTPGETLQLKAIARKNQALTRNKLGEVPLTIAINNNDAESVSVLLSVAPEAIFNRTTDGRTIFHARIDSQFIQWCRFVHGDRLLRPLIATYESTTLEDVFIRGVSRFHPLMSPFAMAVMNSNLELVSLYLEIDPEAVKSIGRETESCLGLAIENATEDKPVLQFLLEYGWKRYGSKWIRDQIVSANFSWINLTGKGKFSSLHQLVVTLRRMDGPNLNPMVRARVGADLVSAGPNILREMKWRMAWENSDRKWIYFLSAMFEFGLNGINSLFRIRDSENLTAMDIVILYTNRITVEYVLKLELPYFPSETVASRLMDDSGGADRIRFLRSLGLIPELPLKIVNKHIPASLRASLIEPISISERLQVRERIYFDWDLLSLLLRWMD